MNYLPILQELSESDTIIILLIGLVVSLLLGFRTSDNKKIMVWMIASIIVYAVCEAVSNIRTNFLLEIILVLLGTVAIGSFIGAVVRLIIVKIKKS